MAFLSIPAVLAFTGILATESRADRLAGYLEFDYFRSDLDSTDAGGRTTRTRSEALLQRYSLTLDKKLYPNLTFLASGTFQTVDLSSDVDGVKSDTTATRRSPYVGLNLRTPLYYTEVVYTRNEEKAKTPFSSLTLVRDAIISTLYWRPDRFPDLKLQYFWEHQYDKERSNTDTVSNIFQITSNYTPTDPLRLYYNGSFRTTDLQLDDTKSEEMSNRARVSYSNSWWQRRITFSLDYNYTSRTVETAASGGGELGFQVIPFAGLSALSDTPGNVQLASNPALIDGDVTAGAGINLGLPLQPGGDARLRNMGLDFLAAKEINTFYVFVDRDVTQVAEAFSWRIYTSADNRNWAPGPVVSPGIYSPTLRRFEIRFANVTARYVKVVTAPLSPAVPFATAYPTILVTELLAELRRPASEVSGKTTSTFQFGTTDLRALLLESIALTYEFSSFFTDGDPGDLQYTISNGLSFSRQFDRGYSVKGRVAFENGEDKVGTREALLYTLSATAIPFQTFYNSLVFSGRDETSGGGSLTENSIFYYNTANLYEGIDTSLGAGLSFQEDGTGRKSKNTQLFAGATFVPNQKATLTLSYVGDTTVLSGGERQGEITNYTRAGEASLSIYPVRTVYLFGSYRIDKTSGSTGRNTLNYSLNWSPFPDGTVQMSFYYNEEIKSDDSMVRSIVPSLRWYFTPKSYLNLSYENMKTENPPPADGGTIGILSTTVRTAYTASVRISF